MPSFVVRPYTEADWPGYAAVRSAVYRGGKAIETGEKLVPDDCFAYVVEMEGRVVGSSVALDMTASCSGPEDLRCAGVASVGVLPEARRYGAGQALMRGMVPYLRAEGFDIASLYAYSEAFYRKVGYEVGSARLEVKAPTTLIPHYRGPLVVRELDREEWPRLVPCYNTFRGRYSGMNDRKESQWRRTFGTVGKLYAASDPVEAFAVISLTEGFFEGQTVRTFAWSTQEGYRAMLGLFRALAMNQDYAAWYEPMDTPFGHRLMQHGASFDWTKQVMYRVVNAPSTLGKLAGSGWGEFTIGVADEDAPENEGPWRVSFEPGRTVVEPTASADLTIGPGALAQGALGALSAGQLFEQGALVGSEGAARTADGLLRSRRTLCLDDF